MKSLPVDTSLDGVHCETVSLNGNMLEIGARFASDAGTVVLMSGGDADSARYDIIAARPWLTLKSRNSQITLTSTARETHLNADPFDVLQQLAALYQMSGLPSAAPVSAGLFGYLAYDLKDHLEVLPQTTMDDLQLPQLCLFAPSIIIVHDRQSHTTQLCIPKRIENGRALYEDDRRKAFEILSAQPPPAKPFYSDAEGLQSTLSRPEYIQAVMKIKEYIAAGDIYQVNVSQRFETGCQGNPYHLFQTLFQNNPAPFFAYINAGDHHIVSTSPERFIQKNSHSVETRPIKGTRPRGTTDTEDARMAQALQTSRKDDAELSMIVDLLRNDLGKVCQAGSVAVSQHKRLESYKNVHHLVSIVEGRLREDRDAIDLIKATFPGGSITGCPKIRSMEIIDELEPVKRHVYTGSIGYIGFQQTLDLSIAIRTATIKDNRIYFSVGGGVVYDSDPEDEFKETLHKAQSLMAVLTSREKAPVKKPVVWINGRLKPEETACVPVNDQGLQYGYGFFETVRVQNGHPILLDAHIQRFYRAWRTLFESEPYPLTWNEIINQVIAANGLESSTVACKILATYGNDNVSKYNGCIIVSVKPYIHRLQALNAPGLRLAVYPSPRQTPLADQKSLNYLYYLLAGKWAKKNGADEAVILNPDHSISETNTANILLIKGNRVCQPLSPHALPGVMELQVLKIMGKMGYATIKEKVLINDILQADYVILTNSLMGAVPVLSIDKTPLPDSREICETLNQQSAIW